jgi:hypothetical protein
VARSSWILDGASKHFFLIICAIPTQHNTLESGKDTAKNGPQQPEVGGQRKIHVGAKGLVPDLPVPVQQQQQQQATICRRS